jgi:hypothetical protein
MSPGKTRQGTTVPQLAVRGRGQTLISIKSKVGTTGTSSVFSVSKFTVAYFLFSGLGKENTSMKVKGEPIQSVGQGGASLAQRPDSQVQ